MPGDDLTRALESARQSFSEQRWSEAYDGLSSAAELAALDAADLERLAVAAYLIGKDAEYGNALARAHEACLQLGDTAAAARCAFWLGFQLVMHGKEAQGSGWLGRAQRLVDECSEECVAQGLLLVPAAIQTLEAGDAQGGFELFGRAAAIAERCDDPDLLAISYLGRGESLIAQGRIAEGVAFLDEAMVAVVTEEIGPIATGIVYCAVLLECRGIFDVRRAREWTEALTKWCAAQPDLVPFRGQCLVHRSEVLQLRGEWPDALDEARRACERLAGQPAIGEAYYQQAEMHRLRGEFLDAEAAYESANQWGREPQPGLALLRLAQHRVETAVASIRRVVEEARNFAARSSVLGAFAEIMLAAGDVPAARAAADELSTVARDHDVPLLRAVAAQVNGAVLLAEGDARAALKSLRRASTEWQEIGAPFEAARARVLIGLACRALGDDETAKLELDAARRVFEDLGAAPELDRVSELSGATPAVPGGLSAREIEVLALVATGKTNHEIGEALVVSDHTVRRHLQNIYAKLGVSSRAAATTFAVQHELV